MKKLFTRLSVLTIIAITAQIASSNSSGPPGAYNNAPGVGNCTACHSDFTLQTSGSIHNSLTLTTSTAISNLQPSTTYTFTLSFADPSSTKYGFQLSVLPNGASSSTASIGTLISTSSETQLTTRGNRSYIEHTSSGTAAPFSTKSWQFNYTTPSAIISPVFYVVINSTDDDNSSSGDKIYAKTFAAAVLPVKWGDIKLVHNDQAYITWSTYCEINNDYFTVEQSYDGMNWETVERVKASGNSVQENKYRLELPTPLKASYYRVKQTDFNGASSYSSVVNFAPRKEAELDFSYAINDLGITLPKFDYEQVKLVRLDGTQHNIQTQESNGNIVLPTAQLKSGVYVLYVKTHSFERAIKVMLP